MLTYQSDCVKNNVRPPASQRIEDRKKKRKKDWKIPSTTSVKKCHPNKIFMHYSGLAQ